MSSEEKQQFGVGSQLLTFRGKCAPNPRESGQFPEVSSGANLNIVRHSQVPGERAIAKGGTPTARRRQLPAVGAFGPQRIPRVMFCCFGPGMSSMATTITPIPALVTRMPCTFTALVRKGLRSSEWREGKRTLVSRLLNYAFAKEHATGEGIEVAVLLRREDDLVDPHRRFGLAGGLPILAVGGEEHFSGPPGGDETGVTRSDDVAGRRFAERLPGDAVGR